MTDQLNEQETNTLALEARINELEQQLVEAKEISEVFTDAYNEKNNEVLSLKLIIKRLEKQQQNMQAQLTTKMMESATQAVVTPATRKKASLASVSEKPQLVQTAPVN